MKFDLSSIELSKNDIKRNLKLPEYPSKELAEFMGIMFGDGFANYYPYQHKYLLEIAGDSRFDKDFLKNYAKNLINDLFNLEPSFYLSKTRNSMNLRIISKGLITYLFRIGFKNGKKGQIEVPFWISSNRDLMLSFLKGIADTDCSIHFRENKYPIITFGSISKPLVSDVFNVLKKEQFELNNFYKETRFDRRTNKNYTIYKIRLNGHKNLKNWMKLISFRNSRHLNKIKLGPLGFEPRS